MCVNNREVTKLDECQMKKTMEKQTWPAVPMQSVNLNASVPYSFMVSRGSMTFPSDFDILRP
jgi:hypothetical protein